MKSVKSMTYIALGAVFITSGSWITIPFAIPFTMQTFALFFVLKIFGGRVGGASILLHTAMGILGLPVFSGFKSGISAVVGPTGGYIIGFAIVGAVYFALESILKENANRILMNWICPILSVVACYGMGTAWYMNYISAETEIGLLSALSVCVLPYILPDLVKIYFAMKMGERVKKYLA